MFKGQLIQNLFKLPNGKNFVVTSVRADMTHEWYEWYTNQIMQQLNEGKELHAIEVKLQLTMFKPLHAQYLTGIYSRMTSADSKDIISKK